jgi:hypothetical protein
MMAVRKGLKYPSCLWCLDGDCSVRVRVRVRVRGRVRCRARVGFWTEVAVKVGED